MLPTILKIVFTISLIIIGYIFSRIIYRKFNFLLEYRNHNESSDIKISVIIPSRNEQDNLPIILDSILNQDYKNIEVIVVDDNSSDNTFDVASSYGVNVLSIKNKPSEWKGKTWACQKGAEISKGDFLLFIDADVYFKKDAISNIVKKYAKEQKVISIIPYHNTGSFIEQFSLFFNVVGVGAVGACRDKKIGLYGPVIFIDKRQFNDIGGFSSVKYSVIEDVDLGSKLTENNIDYDLIFGKGQISYRMYKKDLLQISRGWIKNFAFGASRMSFLSFLLVFFFVSAYISTFINVIKYSINFDYLLLSIFVFLYMFLVIELHRIAKNVGNFSVFSILLYPIFIIYFLIIFIISSFKKIFKLKSIWKERKV
ncbi:MAG: glycosyltransferase family 2 protein [Bacilli bacterium]